MKLIYPDNIVSITADEEDGNYPATNLQDNHPKRVWKGTSRDAVLTVIVNGGGALAVVATNATSVTIALSSGQMITWSGIAWNGIAWDTTGSTDTTETSLLPGDISGCAWYDFVAARTGNFTATITLTAAAGEIIQAGLIRCGTLHTFRDPAKGIKEGLKDYSIIKELNNGATYTRKRDVARTFSFVIMEDRDPDFYTFMLTVARSLGPSPIAWRVVSGITDSEWIIFARFDGTMPAGSHDLPAFSQISISLLEVL